MFAHSVTEKELTRSVWPWMKFQRPGVHFLCASALTGQRHSHSIRNTKKQENGCAGRLVALSAQFHISFLPREAALSQKNKRSKALTCGLTEERKWNWTSLLALAPFFFLVGPRTIIYGPTLKKKEIKDWWIVKLISRFLFSFSFSLYLWPNLYIFDRKGHRKRKWKEKRQRPWLRLNDRPT